MPRSTLSLVLALILFFGFAATAKADVTGSFDIHITLTPECAGPNGECQTESVKFFIDFQSNLQLNVTLSGLTLSADIGFGVTGVEFAILGLHTNLGALGIDDDFVFAPPFGCTYFDPGVSNVGAGLFSGNQCPGISVFPVGDGDGDGEVDNALGFVKKRIQMELNIAGITLTNLALFEDVDFPDINDSSPFGSQPHEHDHIGPGGVDPNPSLYFVGQVDNEVDNQTPTFGFGDVITISGQTVSGITVTGSTTFCASGTNTIKKRSWPYEVNKACTASAGNILDPALEEDAEGVGQKTPLLFEEETLSIEGAEVGGVTIDVYTVWHPNDKNGFNTDIVATFSLLDLADVVVTLSSNNITSLSLDEIDIAVSSGNLSLFLLDFGGDLTVDMTIAVLALVLNPNQNPADLVVQITVCGTAPIPGVCTEEGLAAASFSLGISRGALSLDTTTTFVQGDEGLVWDSTTFSLGVDTGVGFSFGADFEYTPAGMGETSITLGIVF